MAAASADAAVCRPASGGKDRQFPLISSGLSPKLPTRNCGAGLLQDSWDNFSVVRQRVAAEWAALPKTADVISQTLKDKIAFVREARESGQDGGHL